MRTAHKERLHDESHDQDYAFTYAFCFDFCPTHGLNLTVAIDGSGAGDSALCGCQSDQAGRSCGTVYLLILNVFCSDEPNWNFAVQGANGNSFDDPLAWETDS